MVDNNKTNNLSFLTEKMAMKKSSYPEYVKCVAAAYNDAPIHDSRADLSYSALNSSNYNLFKKLLSKINIVFVTENSPTNNTISVAGKEYKVIQHGDPYHTAQEMATDVEKNNRLYISLDYSDHPYFSIEDNIVFRTVHDYIVHILGKKSFGLHGELQAYNLHAKLVPPIARAAAFTEVVGQVCYQTLYGEFPTQKAAILDGFDYVNVGNISEEVIERYKNN